MTAIADHVGTTLYAGFWRRFIAYIIDCMVIYVGVGIVIGIAYATVGSPVTDDGGIKPIFLLLYVFFLIGFWLYFTLMESGAGQATLGKRALSIIVTDDAGRRIGFGRANGRFFSKFLLSALIPFGIGFMLAGWTAKKQALHDLVAGTLVMRTL